MAYPRDESVGLSEEAGNVLVNVVVDRDTLVAQVAAVEAGNDGRRVQYMGHSTLAQPLQIPRCPQRTCSRTYD